jgi:hypothetical protein
MPGMFTDIFLNVNTFNALSALTVLERFSPIYLQNNFLQYTFTSQNKWSVAPMQNDTSYCFSPF